VRKEIRKGEVVAVKESRKKKKEEGKKKPTHTYLLSSLSARPESNGKEEKKRRKEKGGMGTIESRAGTLRQPGGEGEREHTEWSEKNASSSLREAREKMGGRKRRKRKRKKREREKLASGDRKIEA